MPSAIILSSHVAGSSVGASAQAAALAPFKIDSYVVPTVLYGRHPGWGAPGGAAVPAAAFEGILAGIAANGLYAQADLLITGYFASADQVQIAAAAIDAVRAASRPTASKPIIIVDPVMGDEGKGLYVPVEVADAIQTLLLPKADLITPNAWELQRLSGAEAKDPKAAMLAARLLGMPVLVSSVRRGDEIGVVYANKREAWLAAHQRGERVPSGTGDLLTALFGASMLSGQTMTFGLARAVGGLVETITAAASWNLRELPIVAMGSKITKSSPAVRLERLA